MNNNNAIYLTFKQERTALGDSKFFGAPDLPEDFDWPTDGDGFDMEFICQINCEKAHSMNASLPEKGMLYFFGCIANPLGEKSAPEISPGFQSTDNFSVIYSPVPVSSLQSGEIVDENGDNACFNELKIYFTENGDECDDAFHQLLGKAPEDCGEIGGYRLLFCLDSFSGGDFTLEFEDSGYLYFLIREDDLENCDFSKVICFLAV